MGQLCYQDAKLSVTKLTISHTCTQFPAQRSPLYSQALTRWFMLIKWVTHAPMLWFSPKIDPQLWDVWSRYEICPSCRTTVTANRASQSQVVFGLSRLSFFFVAGIIAWPSEFDLRLILLEIRAETRLLNLVTLPLIHASTKLQRSPRFDLAFLRLSFALLRGVANA